MLALLAFKFETKIKIEGRTDGEENAEAGKRRPENMGHRTKRILRIERKEYQTY